MKNIAITTGLGLFCLTLSFLQGCSKDTDLLAETLITDSELSAFPSRIAINDIFYVNENQTVVLDVLSNDTVEESGEIEIVKTSQPQNGTVTINEDKTITYTPEENSIQDEDTDQINEESNEVEANNSETQTDSFDYTIETTDENGDKKTEEATVELVFDYGELKAFPGAEGFGKYSKGGRGGRVIYVTNLNDSGEGSLRHAIDQSGPRTVLFKVSGYITLNSALMIKDNNITIAGQTAPGDGVTLRISGNGDFPCMRVKASDVIIRGIRFRPGPGKIKSIMGDGLVLLSGNNIIIDHCSFSWSTDELTDPYGATNVTYQHCIFSEALMYSSHIYSTDPSNSQYRSPHSMGMLIGDKSDKVSIYNSLFAHNNQRNPLIGGNTSIGGDFELVNNVYYNWGAFGTVIKTGSNSQVNLINSLHIPGNNTNKNRKPILIGETASVFCRNNQSDYRNFGENEELALAYFKSPFNETVEKSKLNKTPFPFPLSDTKLKSRELLLDDILNDSGAFKTDQVDFRIIQDVTNQSGSFIDDPSEVGGYPMLETGQNYPDQDNDGMDDNWEIQNGLNPNDSSDGNSNVTDKGYTNLEKFLHQLTL